MVDFMTWKTSDLNKVYFRIKEGNKKDLLLGSLALMILKMNRTLKYTMTFQITKRSNPADDWQNVQDNKEARLC